MPRKEIDVNDQRTFVECPLCNEKMRTLGVPHIKKHKKIYPNYQILCTDEQVKRGQRVSKQMIERFQDSDFMIYWKEKKSSDMLAVWERDYNERVKLSRMLYGKVII